MNYQHYLSAEGRLDRHGFLVLGGGLVAAAIVLGILPGVSAIAPLLLAWPWTCVATKRLHDIGRDGRLAIALTGLNATLAMLKLLVSATVGAIGLGALMMPVSAAGALIGIASLAMVVWLACAPSEDGPNRFGPVAPAFSLA